jgi:hypothetical protein
MNTHTPNRNRAFFPALLFMAALFVFHPGDRPRAAGPETAGGSNPSIYGILTSDRWAFGASYERRDLEPVKNNNPYPEPQPRRDHPKAMEITPDGKKLYIAMAGNEAEPGNEVAVFDVGEKKVAKRIRVGSSPWHIAMHPKGRFAVVINRLSNYASVIDTVSDEPAGEIPLDFYCQYMVFNKKGTRAYVSSRYLGQVFVLDVKAGRDGFKARMRPLGGFDLKTFKKKVFPTLRKSCGASACHGLSRGDFYAGDDALKAFFSAIENAVPGDPGDSLLLKAVRPHAEGGFADDLSGANFHAGGKAIWSQKDSGYKKTARWIAEASEGPGIPVGNFGSKPFSLQLSHDEKYLYVGNLGTQDISIIDLKQNKEAGAIHTQNVVLDLALFHDKKTDKEMLFALSMGLGFGAAKERDPFGGETEDARNTAAQFSVRRDIDTTEPLPIERQNILGKFDAIDGTAAFKMADIQNDVIAIDTGALKIPKKISSPYLDYVLKANRYEAHRAWTRYTSDSAEVLPQEPSGDIPPELQRVIGAFPEAARVCGDRLYTVMLGSYELVEWKINPSAAEPSDYLEPVAVYPTGIMPREVVCGPEKTGAKGLLFVSNFLGETVSVIDRKSGESKEHVVGNLSRPFPDSNAERGQMFVNTAVFSVDGDTSCMSCHIYDTSDARGWGAGQAIAQTRDGKFVNGGSLAIPQIKNLFATQPFYFEGTHTCFDAQFDDAREHVALQGFLEPNPQGDFTRVSHPVPPAQRPKEHEEIQDKMSTDSFGDLYFDLRERRDEFIRRASMKYFGKAFNFRDFQRFIGEFQAAETRLMPNPYDPAHPSAVRGKRLFNRLDTGCVVCHSPPEFTNKSEILSNNHERVLPSIISFTRREKAFTLVGPHWMDSVNGYKRDLEYWEKGRVERQEGHMTVFPLRGLFDRPFSFLHHGRARSIREVIASPDHYALRKFKYPPLRGGEKIRENQRERGFNEISFIEERTYFPDTHGGTSHLSAVQIRDLENFLLTIE